MRNRSLYRFLFLIFFLGFPTVGYCDVGSAAGVQSTLNNIQRELIGRLLPLAAILGLVWAGFSFVMGHENARGRLMLAILGAAIGFGAPHIVALIQSLVH